MDIKLVGLLKPPSPSSSSSPLSSLSHCQSFPLNLCFSLKVQYLLCPISSIYSVVSFYDYLSVLPHSKLASSTAIRTAFDLVLFDEEYDDIEVEFTVVSQEEVEIEAVIAAQSVPLHTLILEVSDF